MKTDQESKIIYLNKNSFTRYQEAYFRWKVILWKEND